MFGRTGSGVHGFFSSSNFTSGESHHSLTNTQPGEEEDTRK